MVRKSQASWGTAALSLGLILAAGCERGDSPVSPEATIAQTQLSTVTTEATLACGAVVSGRVTLENDLTCGSTSPAITLTGGAVLDLNTHQVDCSGSAVGILLDGDRDTVMNGFVTGCTDFGISVAGSGHHKVQNVNGYQNNNGVRIFSAGNTIKNNNMYSNGSSGITDEAGSNRITGNSCSSEYFGILVLATGDTVSSNTLTANTYGIDVVEGGNTFSRNTATSNASIDYNDEAGCANTWRNNLPSNPCP